MYLLRVPGSPLCIKALGVFLCLLSFAQAKKVRRRSGAQPRNHCCQINPDDFDFDYKFRKLLTERDPPVLVLAFDF